MAFNGKGERLQLITLKMLNVQDVSPLAKTFSPRFKGIYNTSLLQLYNWRANNLLITTYRKEVAEKQTGQG